MSDLQDSFLSATAVSRPPSSTELGKLPSLLTVSSFASESRVTCLPANYQAKVCVYVVLVGLSKETKKQSQIAEQCLAAEADLYVTQSFGYDCKFPPDMEVAAKKHL